MASKLGAALGFPGLDSGSADEGDSSDASMEPSVKDTSEKKPDGGGSAETMAMKMFEKASSTEAKVTAMKAFLEACGATSSDY